MSKFENYYLEEDQNLLVSLLKSRGSNLLSQMINADKIRKIQVGNQVTFIRNQNINFSNICYTGCKFCAYAATENSQEAYRMSQKQLDELSILARERKVSEICSTAGLDPKSDLETYTNVIRTFKKNHPEVHVHAFSPFEIQFLAEKEKVDNDEIISSLMNAGLDSMAGTAAEILVPEIREILNPGKLNTNDWIDIITTAHMKGLKSTATIMYGHIETVHDIAKHLQIIRGIQEETEGFTEFIPLPFVHNNTYIYKIGRARAGSTGMMDMALYSTSRLYMGDVLPNLQSSWVKTGMKFATMALSAGVNDLGGTLFEEKITKSAGGKYGTYKTEEEFIRFIIDADRIPVRRDTMYNIIENYKNNMWIDLS